MTPFHKVDHLRFSLYIILPRVPFSFAATRNLFVFHSSHPSIHKSSPETLINLFHRTPRQEWNRRSHKQRTTITTLTGLIHLDPGAQPVAMSPNVYQQQGKCWAKISKAPLSRPKVSGAKINFYLRFPQYLYELECELCARGNLLEPLR